MTTPAEPRDRGRDWRSNVRLIADVVQSLAVPLLTVAVTVVGLYATNTLKEREIAIATENNAQSLRNQREESETNLRSAMFRELVGPLLQSEALASGAQADRPRAQRLALVEGIQRGDRQAEQDEVATHHQERPEARQAERLEDERGSTESEEEEAYEQQAVRALWAGDPAHPPEQPGGEEQRQQHGAPGEHAAGEQRPSRTLEQQPAQASVLQL